MSSTKTQSNEKNSSFKVFIRVRPFNQLELNLHAFNNYLTYNQSQIFLKLKNQTLRFKFDQIYHPKTTQEDIFNSVADDLIDNAFLGINGTIFCYGQTSSGKTHTIVGDYSTKFSENQGLLPRIIRQVIQRKNTKIQNIKESSVDIRVKISMVQIYNEKVIDLFDMNKRDLKLRENKKQGVFIQNVTQKYIVSAIEAMDYVKQGLQNRTVGKTNMNAYSSRSHMVFIVTIHQTNFQSREAKSAKITLTDLAGSQKISKTGVQGKMLIEAKKINTSLSTLGKVIQALSESKTSHIPYRDSKLTRILQESIGGNSLTRLIINVSSSSANQHQTITSLRFGSRAKLIKNKPKVNKQYTVQQLLILLEKAEMKIKNQMKIIEQFQQGHFSHFGRRNGGYSGLGGYERSITMHMIGDDDEEEFDDASSNGSHSFVKSVASNQQKCNVSIFGDTGVFFNQTSDFNFEAPSSKKKIRKPNLSYSKSMKAIPTLDPQQDQQISDEYLLQGAEQYSPSIRKVLKSVKIMHDKDSDEDSLNDKLKNSTIYEQNESGMEESLKNSVGVDFKPHCKSVSRDIEDEMIEQKQDEQEKLWNKEAKQELKESRKIASISAVKFSDITNNENSNSQMSSTNYPQASRSRPNSKSPKDRQKENGIAQLTEEIKQKLKQQTKLQIKEQLREQIKEQLREQLKKQIQEQLKQQLKEQISNKLNQEFITHIFTLQTKVQTMKSDLLLADEKVKEVQFHYQQTQKLIQQQKQTIKVKDQYIIELKDKYKAKKNQINKEISKLKNFWQGNS